MHALFALAIGILLLALPLGPAPTDAADPTFEVLVVGTIHAPWQFRSRAFHPGHVRAALEVAKPDVIGVESNPTWFAEGKFHDVTYEAQGIAVPWARARGIPVCGIDWMNISAWRERGDESDRRRAEHLEKMRTGGGLGGWAFGEVAPNRLDDLQRYFASEELDFRVVNDIGSDTYGKKWLQRAASLKPFGGHRHEDPRPDGGRMAGDQARSPGLRQSCRHPGQRLRRPHRPGDALARCSAAEAEAVARSAQANRIGFRTLTAGKRLKSRSALQSSVTP